MNIGQYTTCHISNESTWWAVHESSNISKFYICNFRPISLKRVPLLGNDNDKPLLTICMWVMYKKRNYTPASASLNVWSLNDDYPLFPGSWRSLRMRNSLHINETAFPQHFCILIIINNKWGRNQISPIWLLGPYLLEKILGLVFLQVCVLECIRHWRCRTAQILNRTIKH